MFSLYRAVDKALAGVLSGHPRLLAYDIHALGEGTGDRCGDGPDLPAGERGGPWPASTGGQPRG
jgi:hypothetical protein